MPAAQPHCAAATCGRVIAVETATHVRDEESGKVFHTKCFKREYGFLPTANPTVVRGRKPRAKKGRKKNPVEWKPSPVHPSGANGRFLAHVGGYVLTVVKAKTGTFVWSVARAGDLERKVAGGAADTEAEAKQRAMAVVGRTPWSANPEPPKEVQKVAVQLMKMESSLWEKLGIESGSQLRDDPGLQVKYGKGLLKRLGKKKFDPRVYLVLENENYHTLNRFLEEGGYFTGPVPPTANPRRRNIVPLVAAAALTAAPIVIEAAKPVAAEAARRAKPLMERAGREAAKRLGRRNQAAAIAAEAAPIIAEAARPIVTAAAKRVGEEAAKRIGTLGGKRGRRNGSRATAQHNPCICPNPDDAPTSYPAAIHPSKVGQYPLWGDTGGGYFYDRVLEYRVWVKHADGSLTLDAFATHDEAKRFADKAETEGNRYVHLVVLVEQDPGHWVDEPRAGAYKRGTSHRLTEWRTEWLDGRYNQKGMEQRLAGGLPSAAVANPRTDALAKRGPYEIRKRGKYVREKVAEATSFDARSFRTVPTGPDHKVIIGCPVGQWDDKSGRCRVGTQAQSILHPLGEAEKFGVANPEHELPLHQNAVANPDAYYAQGTPTTADELNPLTTQEAYSLKMSARGAISTHAGRAETAVEGAIDRMTRANPRKWGAAGVESGFDDARDAQNWAEEREVAVTNIFFDQDSNSFAVRFEGVPKARANPSAAANPPEMPGLVRDIREGLG